MRIGEIAAEAGVATSTIRFYEESGLLPQPERTPTGYRDYDSSVLDRLTFIRAGQAVGLKLEELKDVLGIRDNGDSPCHHVTELLNRRIREIDRRMRDLRKLRRGLVDISAEAADFDPVDCPPESICRILNPTTEQGQQVPPT